MKPDMTAAKRILSGHGQRFDLGGAVKPLRNSRVSILAFPEMECI